MALITVKDLSIGYESGVVAEHIDLEVNEGDYLIIIGENGSGKSTFMKTLLRLKKPLSGTVEYGDGLEADMIGYLPQQSQIQKDFPASVREIVLSGCQGRCGLRPFYNKGDKELASKNMELMGISSLADRCYRELSGGQQQRVLLARALCATDKLLLLDEPVSGLDPEASGHMYELIASLNKRGITVIMISHDIEAAHKYGSRIMDIGKEVYHHA